MNRYKLPERALIPGDGGELCRFEVVDPFVIKLTGIGGDLMSTRGAPGQRSSRDRQRRAMSTRAGLRA